jgi:transcriptional regulator with XRE-family HTH domain
MEESGRRLKDLRGKRKLREICELVPGLKEQRLSNWEQGTRMISVDEAKKIAPVLGTSAEYILTLTDKQPDPAEVQLIALFRNCDERGKLATLDTVQKQASFVEAKTPTENAVATQQPQQLEWKGPERRAGEPERRKVNLGFDPERRHYFPAPSFPQKPNPQTDRRRKTK